MFERERGRDGEGEAVAAGGVVGDGGAERLRTAGQQHLVGAGLRGGGDEAGRLRQANGAEGIDIAEAVVDGGRAAAVPVGRPVDEPASVLVGELRAADRRAGVEGGAGEEVLHIAPAEARVGVEHEGDDTGDHRAGKRGAAPHIAIVGSREDVVARRALVHVGRSVVEAEGAAEIGAEDGAGAVLGVEVEGEIVLDEIAARRRHQQAGAVIGVACRDAGFEDRADRDGVARDVEREAVGVGVVVDGAVDRDGAEAAAAVLRGVGEGVEQRDDGALRHRQGLGGGILEEIAQLLLVTSKCSPQRMAGKR